MPKARKAKRASWPYFNVEWARRAISCGGSLQDDETVEDRNPNGLKSIDDLALKQNMYR